LQNSYNIIEIKNLSKRYTLGVISTGMLTKDISSAWARFQGKEDPNSRVMVNNLNKSNISTKVWALKSVSLELKQGEILGIIGKNGAGKSTILKILSRITSPTEGEARIKGRVGSLLEIGTGFHPELTGRENIYLNGSILGLRKNEIDQRLDRIVDFSGIEQYIDTPVKRYSPGMYVRLGFAVAAHLDLDILIVDEVLAVGDMEFQKKAVGAMQNTVGNSNRTVIFVSHNMEMIKSLCNRCIVIEKGEIFFDGNVDEAVGKYKELNNDKINLEIIKDDCQIFFDEEPDRPFQINSIRITNATGDVENNFSIEEQIFVHFNFIVRRHTIDLMVNLSIFEDGQLLLASNINDYNNDYRFRIKRGQYKATIIIPSLTLKAGDYQLRGVMGISNYLGNVFDTKKGIEIKIHDKIDGLASNTTFTTRAGKVLFPAKWDIDYKELK
jgi:lipopolysaccharide transport system ATP-binding protein